MPEIGIRQLKNETSEILRAVREEQAEYVITLRGQPVAVLKPIEQPEVTPDEILALATSVFEGLNAEELAEIEDAMKRWPDFFDEQVDDDL